MFRRLRHKLTVLYAGLFCAALVLIGATAYAAIANATHRLAQDQLARAGAVFSREADLRTANLRQNVAYAAQAPELQMAAETDNISALQRTLTATRTSAQADLAFFVTREGLVIGEDATPPMSVPPGLQRALAGITAPSGVLRFGDGIYLTATAAIGAGEGWIVIGEALDADAMRALERVASVPLRADIVSRDAAGWRGLDGEDAALLSSFLDESRGAGGANTDTLSAPSGRTLAHALALPSLDAAPTMLLVRYGLSSTISEYGALFGTLLAIGIAGLAGMLVATWFLAQGITRPLSTLEIAARQMQDGVFETVQVRSKDELARLAESFNAMIGAIRERERRITQLAYHDVETRLPNRLALERKLASIKADRLYLAAIRIDRFAEVRGAIGYAMSGALMQTIGQRLARLVPNAPMARLSSDTLGVAFLADNDADARKRCEALVQSLEQPLALDGNDIDVSISVGAAQPRAKAETPASMIERASIALDQTRTTRQKVALFDEAAYGDPGRNLSLMSEMRRAIENGEMMLVHQPKYDFRSGRIESAEALVRWKHPTRGMTGPDVFVPMAEETGHIRALTEWVIAQAIADQKRLHAAGLALTISVNISARVLSDVDFARAALALVRQAPHQLCFEITETAVIDNPQLAFKTIELFAANGVRIAIDDYGSGLSSLAYLKQLPAHELKIDKMFVESITQSQRDALLVRSTIDLAHGLGMEVVAEGVETPAAFALLAAMKCDLAQGFLVARPLSVQELAALLRDERRLRFYQQTAATGSNAAPLHVAPKTA